MFVHSVFTAVGGMLHHYGYFAIVTFFVLEGSGIRRKDFQLLPTAHDTPEIE